MMKLGDQVDAAALCPAFQRSVCIPVSLRASDCECGELGIQWSGVWAAS